MGVRHAFAPQYGVGFGQTPPPSPAAYTYQCTLESGPPGMSLSASGNMEWIPTMDASGTTASYSIHTVVIENGAQIYAATDTFSIEVLATLPQLLTPAPRVSYEDSSFGYEPMRFSGYQPPIDLRYEDLATLSRWSLIDAPPGVYIDASGALHWADDRGAARTEPYTFTVRIDYETASGPVSNQVTYSRRVLPCTATNKYTDLEPSDPATSGMLGFSTAAGDGWLAVGEPFPGFASVGPVNPNPGRVLIMYVDSEGYGYSKSYLEPVPGVNGQAFGASVALAKRDNQNLIHLAVGAPEATLLNSSGTPQAGVGYVYVYVYKYPNWSQEARLDPPVIRAGLNFGGWVAIQGNTLIASMDGMDTAGPHTGALAVFQHDASGWVFSQMLEAPAPAAGDYFSYPAALSDDWVAAAANEDDAQGNNAGAVHLFQKQGTQYAHRQKIHAPIPEAGALFGERLLINGPWLFVSSFRQQANQGAVHVYHLSDGVWSFHQTLTSPFATAGSAFGIGLSCADEVLAVSAPGYLFGSAEINGLSSPWKGITLFRLEGDSWNWSRQVSNSPEGNQPNTTWGFSLVQLSPNLTIAAMPDQQARVGAQQYPLAGRLFLHRWPTRLADPFATVLAGLPANQGKAATANDDSNHNGVPNIIEWLVGQDPGAGTGVVPQSKQPFLKLDAGAHGVRFMVPQLRAAPGHQAVIESSTNLIDWQPASDARWEPPAATTYTLANGSTASASFHPVFIPLEDAALRVPRFYRMGAK